MFSLWSPLKDMCVRLTDDTKVILGESVCGCLFIRVEDVPHIVPEDRWDRFQKTPVTIQEEAGMDNEWVIGNVVDYLHLF